MISVIIPTYNEKPDLEKCIESLGDQTQKDFEIIVADDGSTDGSIEILENLKKTIKNFNYVRQHHNGAGAARNLGASVAKGDILVFVDSDMTFREDFLENLVAPIKTQVRGTFSKEEYVANWDNVWARCWNVNENWEDRKRHPKTYPDEQPVFRAILKSEFEKVDGFTPGGYDDDWSLYKKLGFMAVNAPAAVFYHKNPSSLWEIFKHAQWVAKREYKLGTTGSIVALLRASFPISLIVGVSKSIIYFLPAFVIFKVVYDAGIFIGILKYLRSKKGAK